MPLHQSDSIILKTYPLGEADRIVAFFRRDRGKMRGVPNGARRMKNTFGVSLEPVAHSRNHASRKAENVTRANHDGGSAALGDGDAGGVGSSGLGGANGGTGRSIHAGA